jgi:hypothetical protein
MMNLQTSKASRGFRFEHQRRLAAGEILRLGEWPGELSVVDGRIWLTRPGDPDDHWLHSGEAMALRRSDGAVVEAGGPGAATLRWTPLREVGPMAAARRGLLQGLAAATRSAALVLDRAGRWFDAAARPHNSRLPADAAAPCPTPSA